MLSGYFEDVRADGFAQVLLKYAKTGSGLEVENYRNVGLLIESLPGDLIELGLTKERIRTRLELRLRSLNLIPVAGGDRPEFLYVRVSGIGNAFTVRLELNRPGNYLAPDGDSFAVYKMSVATWAKGMLGSHGGSAAYILERLDQSLNEYLKANQP